MSGVFYKGVRIGSVIKIAGEPPATRWFAYASDDRKKGFRTSKLAVAWLMELHGVKPDFADRYEAAREAISDRLAAEIVSRNSISDQMDELHRTEGETDIEFVRRIVATYLAIEGGK